MAERRDSSMVDGVLFRLLQASNLVARPFPATVGKRYRLTLASWRAMMVIAAEPGVSGEDVARLTGLDRMSASRALRLLEKESRATRRGSARDRKRFEWRLTDAGWKLFGEIRTAASARERFILKDFDAAQLAHANEVLTRIIRLLGDEA